MPVPASGGAIPTKGAKILRLAYHGCTNRPFFHLVVMQKNARRQELCIEQLGTYDPLPNIYGEKLCALNMERITYWIGEKAQCTKGVQKLLGLTGLFPIHPRIYIEGWELRRRARELREQQQNQKEEEA